MLMLHSSKATEQRYTKGKGCYLGHDLPPTHMHGMMPGKHASAC